MSFDYTVNRNASKANKNIVNLNTENRNEKIANKNIVNPNEVNKNGRSVKNTARM